MPTILYLEMKLGDFVTGGNLRGYVTSLKFFMNSDERDSKKKSNTVQRLCATRERNSYLSKLVVSPNLVLSIPNHRSPCT